MPHDGSNDNDENDGRHGNGDDVNDDVGAWPGGGERDQVRAILQCPGRHLVMSREYISRFHTTVIMMVMMGIMAP